jgi:hypothetical protein
MCKWKALELHRVCDHDTIDIQRKTGSRQVHAMVLLYTLYSLGGEQ